MSSTRRKRLGQKLQRLLGGKIGMAWDGAAGRESGSAGPADTVQPPGGRHHILYLVRLRAATGKQSRTRRNANRIRPLNTDLCIPDNA